MFGPLFRIGEQFLFELTILRFGLAAAAGARQRPYSDDTVGNPAHDFRRTTDQNSVTGPHKKHERAGIDDSQTAVDLQRIELRWDRKPLARHHLKDVACVDVADTSSHRLAERFPCEIAGERRLAQRLNRSVGRLGRRRSLHQLRDLQPRWCR